MQAGVGHRLGRFRLLDILGSGGFATVYRAEDTQLGTLVAIKVLHPHLAANGDFVTRFFAEARSAARLRGHPHIVTIYDVATSDDGRPYLVMSLVEGTPLSQLLSERGRPSSAQAASIVTQLASALDYLHAAGLVHRDLKPANIIVGANGDVTLLDLGIARSVSESSGLTQTGQALGTPAYMAPEQITGAEITAAADIYALGILTYELLSGHPPFTGSSTSVRHAQVATPPPALRRINPGVPPRAAAAVARALAKDPADRPRSATAFAQLLADDATETVVLPHPAKESGRIGGWPPSRWPPPARWLGGIAVLLLVALLAGLAYLHFRSSPPSVQARETPTPEVSSSVPPIVSVPVSSLEPLDLYHALLDTPVTQAELPRGFSAAAAGVVAERAEDRDQAHNALGQAHLVAKGSDQSDYVDWVVFDTAADAKAVVDDAYSSEFTPPGFSDPARCFTGTDTSSSAGKYGYTTCVVLSGNTYVYAESDIGGSSATRGNDTSAAGLAMFGLTHLQKVRAAPAPPRSAQATPTPAPTAPPALTPTVLSDDAASAVRLDEVKGDATEFLARYGVDYGFLPNRPLVVHVASDEATARSSLAQNLGLAQADVDAFFTGKLDTQVALAPSGQIEALIYLPTVTSDAVLRQALAFDTASYALRLVGKGTETSDVYPYWFWRGFENYQEVRLAGADSSRQEALKDLQAGTAPDLSTIARYSDGQSFINAHRDGQAILDRRGEATIEFLVQKYGAAAVGRLLVSSGSTIDDFNALLQQITGQNLSQLNSALNTWLQQ